MTRAGIAIIVGVVIVLFLLVSAVLGIPAVFAGPFTFPLFIVLLVVANIALVLGAIVSVLIRGDLTGVQRLVWLGIVILVNPVVAVGSLVYFGLGKARTAQLFRDVGAPAAPVNGSERPGGGS